MISGIGNSFGASAATAVSAGHHRHHRAASVPAGGDSSASSISSQGRTVSDVVSAFRSGASVETGGSTGATGAAPHFGGAMTMSRAS